VTDRAFEAGTAAAARPVRAGTATRATRLLGAAALVGVAWLVAFGLGFSPADRDQAESVRILYVHVPSAWLAYLAFIVTAGASAIYLFSKRHSLGWDRLAGASAEVGVLFMGITLVTGMLWGRLTWGVFWEWDARLTTTAFLFVTYIGYLAVRRLGGSFQQRARRSAVLALLAVLEIPLVHWSVRLWRSLHQEATVLRPDGDVRMDGLMLFTLFVGLVAFTLLYAWLVIHRQRTLSSEDALESSGLDLAIAARRAEARDDAAAEAPGGAGVPNRGSTSERRDPGTDTAVETVLSEER
jgi:heme exporter protein C